MKCWLFATEYTKIVIINPLLPKKAEHFEEREGTGKVPHW